MTSYSKSSPSEFRTVTALRNSKTIPCHKRLHRITKLCLTQTTWHYEISRTLETHRTLKELSETMTSLENHTKCSFKGTQLLFNRLGAQCPPMLRKSPDNHKASRGCSLLNLITHGKATTATGLFLQARTSEDKTTRKWAALWAPPRELSTSATTIQPSEMALRKSFRKFKRWRTVSWTWQERYRRLRTQIQTTRTGDPKLRDSLKTLTIRSWQQRQTLKARTKEVLSR